jgi:hypothetical protein
MYSVKKFNKGETIWMADELGFKTTSTTYAVVTKFDDVVLGTDLRGRKVFETYSVKSAAQKQADYYNGKIS